MCMREQWQLHRTSQWGQQTPVSEHVYCVAIAFKMTERLSNESASNFALSLNIPPQKLSGWFRGHSYEWLVIGSFIMTTSLLMHHVLCRVFWQNSKSHPYRPDLVPCDFWLFPKLVSLLKGKKFQTVDEIQENTMGQLMATERTVWGPKVPTLKGTEAPLFYVQHFLYVVPASINVSIFHSMWLNAF